MDGAELIAEHGMLLQSGRGAVTSIPELVVGAPVSGGWWAHPAHDEIFRVLNEAADSPDVVRLRLVDGKLTLVHRRLWPALVRLQHLLAPSQLDAITETHTSSGHHRKATTAFPGWVPAATATAAAELSEAAALDLLPRAFAERIARSTPS